MTVSSCPAPSAPARSRPARSRALVVLALALLVTGMAPQGCPGTDPIANNEDPVARLVWPQLWLVTEPVPFDASASEDADGLIGEHTLVFGDGTEAQTSLDGHFEHLYASPGSFEFRLEVRDDNGAPAELVGTVVVVERLDDPLCTCQLPCLDDAVCTSEGCFYAAAQQGLVDVGRYDGGPDLAPPAVAGALRCP